MSVTSSRAFTSKYSNDEITVTCDPCRFSGKNSAALKYCKDCGGHFCMYCAKLHLKASPTKKHTLITLIEENETKKPTGKTRKTCQEHGAKLTKYCESHEVLCCNVCVLASHKECIKVTSLKEIADRNVVFRMCKDLESAIKRLQNKFEALHAEKQDYIKSVEQQTEALVINVNMYRKTIDGILNKLEREAIRRKDEFCKERTDTVNGQIKTCKTAITILDEAYKQVDTTLKESNADMFVNAKTVQNVVNKYSEVLSKIEPSEKEGLRFVPDLNIEKYLGGLEALGEVLVEKYSAVRKDNSPSIASSRRSTSENRKPNFTADINVKMKSDKKTCFITGATFLYDGRLVLADDTNKCVKLFGPDFKPVCSIITATSPRDVTTISHHEVAATLPAEKLIQMLRIGPKEIVKLRGLLLDIECYGITYHMPDLYVTSGWSAEREIQIINPDGELRKKIRLSKSIFRYPLYISIDPKAEVMYVSDYLNGVLVLDMTGKVIMQCKDADKGSYYKGVEVTVPGQVYACQWQDNGITRVHTDGRGLETVLSWDKMDRRKPLAIAYTSKTKRLVVSFCGEKRDLMSIYKFY